MAALFATWVPYLRVLLVAALLLLPFLDLNETRRMRRHTSSPIRLQWYRSSALIIWVFTALALLLAVPHNLLILARSQQDIAWLLGTPSRATAAAVLLGILFTLYLGQFLVLASSRALRSKYAKAAKALRGFLPVSAEERRWWLFMSITAGICEELLIRGFLLQFLNGQIEGGVALGLTAAWIISSVIFGICHFYQGLRGVVGTAVAGALLGLLAIVSGDLLLPILAHALLDAVIILAYRPQVDHPAQATLLEQGCDLTMEG
jgi:membrane protease YdiL (CAAX protease family)